MRMQFGPRRRVFVALLVVGLGGYLSKRMFGVGHRRLGCSSALARSLNLCTSETGYRSWVRALIVALLLGAVVLVVYGISRWALRPIRALTTTVARLGPHNLVERVPLGRPEEVTELAAALNQMMDRLAAGYEGQRSFAANASHELRTPLAVQRTLIEVSMSRSLSADQLDLLTRQLLETNERNERLIEGLLVLSESERGLVGATSQRLDEIARSAVERHQESADQGQLTIDVDLVPVTIFGEGVLLDRLVANLVQNAIKYNHPAGCVNVTVDDSPAVRVTNSGPVVPAEDVPALFEPFRRMTGTRIEHGGGAGLGLAIVRSIAQAHGASVTASPRAEGGLSVEVAFTSN
jgi:signal transduction histidine kinase